MTNQKFRVQAKALLGHFDPEKARAILIDHCRVNGGSMVEVRDIAFMGPTQLFEALDHHQHCGPDNCYDIPKTLVELVDLIPAHSTQLDKLEGVELGEDELTNICIVTDKPVTISNVNGKTVIFLTNHCER